MSFGAVNVDVNPGGIISAIFAGIDAITTSDEERLKLKQAALEAERAGNLEEFKVTMSAIVAEAQSADPWTSRARPSFLYIMYSIIILCFVGGILAVFAPGEVEAAAVGVQRMLNAIPGDLWWLFGAGYLGYSGMRSFDKWKGVAK